MNRMRNDNQLSRRRFLERAGGMTGMALAGAEIATSGGFRAAGEIPSRRRIQQGTPLGSLYPFLHDLQQESQFKLSFLQNEFKELDSWKRTVREKLWQMIPEKPDPCDFKPEVVERTDQGDYIREKVYFHSTPVTRVPAYVLIPKKVPTPMPGLVCFHDHGGMYYWGKEKIVKVEDEHPVLQEFKRTAYGGRSYATEFCRAGFAVIVIDAFYWGERRLVTDQDIEQAVNDRSRQEPADLIQKANLQSSQSEDMVARALGQIGHTWQGIWLRDEIRSLDYLLTRPEVDPNRIGCVGLSIGGFRSAQFAGLDPRVKCAVVDGWMTSYGEMFSYRPLNTHYLQYITGAYALLDLPDLVSLCCPGALMVIHGRKDVLFTPRGVAEAYQKIGAVYRKAGVSSHADLRYYDTPHEFNPEMQRDALAWLKKWLRVR